MLRVSATSTTTFDTARYVGHGVGGVGVCLGCDAI